MPTINPGEENRDPAWYDFGGGGVSPATPSADSHMAGLNENDRTEIRRMIADHRPGGIPLWIKESLALTIVMGGAAFIVSHYIPAQIGNQTSLMVGDIASLQTSVGTIQKDVADIKKDVKDTLNRALDRAYQALPHTEPQSAPKKKSAFQLGNEAIEIANDL